MGFGKNPHVAKAEAAEQKAQLATNEAARTLAWREAARLWDRAAEREQRNTVATSYQERAVAARAAADADPDDAPEPEAGADTADTAQDGPSESDPDRTPARWLN
jgi:multidrug resistance efflux pump